MFKKIILMVGTLGIVLVLYSIYQMGTSSPVQVDEQIAQGPSEKQLEQLEEVSQGEIITGTDIQNMSYTGGTGGEVIIMDPETNERRLRLGSKSWQQVNDNELRLVEPVFQIRMPGGQVARITSDLGQIYMDQISGNPEPRRGWLRGNVVVVIDRTTPDWRRENPDRVDQDKHPEQLVTLHLDDLTFDLDLARMESDGPFDVKSQEAEIAGAGIILRWNETQQRIEQLEIREGRRMRLVGRRMARFALPGSDKPKDPEAVAKAAAAKQQKRSKNAAPAMVPVRLVDSAEQESMRIELEPEEEETPDAMGLYFAANQPMRIEIDAEESSAAGTVGGNQPMTIDGSEGDDDAAATDAVADAAKADEQMEYPTEIDGEPVLDLRVKYRKRFDPAPTVYQAKFDGDVHVEQLEGGKVAGRMFADTLELLFDFGSRERAAFNPTVNSTEVEESTTDGLDLKWSGKFVMSPTEAPEAVADAEEDDGQRLHIIATGMPVRLEAGQGSATCRLFRFENESKRVYLEGTPEDWAVVSGTAGDLLTGPTIWLDQRKGDASIEGPGRMVREERNDETGEVRLVSIEWSRDMAVKFELIGDQEYLRQAIFQGDVKVQQGEDTGIEGQYIRALFAPPRRRASRGGDVIGGMALRGEIERLDCREGVRLAQGEEELRCDRLMVLMASPPGGSAYPREADAWGNVVVREGDAHIEATEHMFVRMELQDKDGPRGPSRATPNIAELNATGDVSAYDPGNQMDVRATELACLFGPNNTIKNATILGADMRPAMVHKDEYRVSGPHIDIDARGPSLDVRGAGNLEFLSDRRLDGRPADDPMPVAVVFSRGLQIRGQDNVIFVDGDVEAISRERKTATMLNPAVTPTDDVYMLNCDQLRIDLVDDESSNVFASSGKSQSGGIQKVLSGKADAGETAVAGMAGAQVAVPGASTWVPLSALLAKKLSESGAPAAKESRMGRNQQSIRFTKRPIAVNAIGNAVASLATFEVGSNPMPTTRMQISGPTIVSDLISERINVEGAGHMLIEDYRLPTIASRRTNQVDPLLGESGSQGPSQSLFTWENSLTYFRPRRLGILDRGVEVVHRSGSEMAYADRLAQAAQVSSDDLRRLGGRRVEMNCDHMLVEFLSAIGETSADSGAASLQRFQASGNVHLQEGTKSISGTRINYWQETEIVQVEGDSAEPARFFDADPTTGYVKQQVRGEKLRWDRTNKRIEVIKPTVLATRR